MQDNIFKMMEEDYNNFILHKILDTLVSFKYFIKHKVSYLILENNKIFYSYQFKGKDKITTIVSYKNFKDLSNSYNKCLNKNMQVIMSYSSNKFNDYSSNYILILKSNIDLYKK
ncbi:hypothetical protein J2Z53_001375 [Clostridium moniliforme]|uniref:Uncharacterized protein n=1 Tax=Clostridium moniliforme TaxID=39489 RepID=A0ABS4F0M6_9CLOT|nr:hypothetical protein [Clostridium moniliforme]MBP1889792.1 hypothetical protein [Clostridium moniliforme]